MEVAGHEALRCHGPSVLRSGVDLIVLSVGALADPALEAELREAATAGGSRAMSQTFSPAGHERAAATASVSQPAGVKEQDESPHR